MSDGGLDFLLRIDARWTIRFFFANQSMVTDLFLFLRIDFNDAAAIAQLSALQRV